MNTGKVREFITDAWAYQGGKSDIVTALEKYIAVPNVSPAFDPDWAENGHMDEAVKVLTDAVETLKAHWGAKGVPTDDIRVLVHSCPDKPLPNEAGKRRSPLIQVDIPARGAEGCVLLYGHMDKQPGLADRWSEGLGPCKPVIREGRLYGRGGADDGYALFGAFSAVMALRAQGAAHARCVILVESAEESGSEDLEYYMRMLQAELGEVTLIVCLDSGCGDYDRLWLTNSLRGVVSGTLSVGVLREGVHSGDASGVVPTPFRIMRQLFSRLEDETTGEILPDFLKVEIPHEVRKLTEATTALQGNGVYDNFPFLEGVRPADERLVELALNRAWRSALVIKGMDGMPPVAGSGNVLLPDVAASLSLRTPPTLDSEVAGAGMKKLLEANPPYNAKVAFSLDNCGDGWAAPDAAGWLGNALVEASETYFGNDFMAGGEGGSIPFMGLLAELFPSALFFVTGVLGPASNAHGPDEFLDLPTAQKVIMAVAHVVAAQALA